MSPTTGQGPGQRSGQGPGRRPGQRAGGVAAFAPIVVAVCVIVLVRDGLKAIFPDLNGVVMFVVALAVGWLAYTGVERWYARRNGPGAGGKQGPGEQK